MELKKTVNSEMKIFNEKFLGSGKKYHVEYTATGEITKIRSTDKDIIKFAKELDLS